MFGECQVTMYWRYWRVQSLYIDKEAWIREKRVRVGVNHPGRVSK